MAGEVELSSGDNCLRSALSRTELHEYKALGKQAVHFTRSKEGWSRSLEHFPSTFSLAAIQEYLILSGQNAVEHEDIRRYWLVKGNQKLQSHNCKQVELRYTESFVIARSYVERSQTVRDTYATAVYVRKQTAMPIGAYCSCPARNSETCSHVIGLLLYLLDSLEKALPLPVAERLLLDDEVGTDLPRLWDKPGPSKVNPVPLNECGLQQNRIGHSDISRRLHDPSAYYAPRVSPLDQGALNAFVDTMMEHQPAIPYASHAIAQRTIQLSSSSAPDAQGTLESVLHPLPLPIFETSDWTIALSVEQQNRISGVVSLTTQEAKQLEIRTRGQNTNSTWMRERKLRLTASEFGGIISLTRADPDKRAEELGKLGLGYISKAMQEGMDREAAIAQRAFENVQQSLGGIPGSLIKSPGLIVNPEMPHLGASVDGFMVFEANPPIVYPLEVKYAASEGSLVEYASKSSTFLMPNGNSVKLKPNTKWFHQTQGQLAVTGCSEGYFAIEARSQQAGLGEFHIEKTTIGQDWPLNYEKLTKFYFDHYLAVVNRNLSSASSS